MSDLPERGVGDGSEGGESKKQSIPSVSTGGGDDVSSENVSGACSKPIKDDTKTPKVEGAHKIDTSKSFYCSFEPNAEILEQIISMGIGKEKAIRGLYRTGNNSAEAAISWIFENADSEVGFGATEIPELAELAANEEFKMVFAVNCSLNMGIGKTAAQVAHAALALQAYMCENDGDTLLYDRQLNRWSENGETKVVLKADNAEQLKILAAKAQSLKLPNYLVTDAGRTQIPAGSVTVLSIFGRVDLVDQVTRQLKLL